MNRLANPARSTPETPLQIPNNVLILLVGMVLAVGCAARMEYAFLPLFDHFSWREASTAMMADNLPRNGWNPLWPEVSWTGDQPGYQGREFQTLTIITAALNETFGWQDWYGRAVAAIFGCISTLALFRLVCLLNGQIAGLFAALIYAVAPGPIMIDTSYLPDPAMLAFTLSALALLAQGLYRSSRTLIAAAVLVGTLALLAKLPSAAALPAAAWLVAASAPHGQWLKRILMFFFVLVPVFVIVGAYYAWTIYLGNTYPPFHVAGHGWLWQFGWNAFASEAFWIDTFIWHADFWLWRKPVILLAVIGFVIATAIPWAAFRDGSLRGRWFWHIYALGCAVFYVAAAHEVKNNSWNLHIMNPMVAAFSGIALSAITSRGRSGERIALVVAVASVVAAGVLIDGRHAIASMKFDQPGRVDIGLGRQLEALTEEGDIVIVSGEVTGSPLAILYSRRRGFVFPPPEHSPDSNYTLFSEDGEIALDILSDLISRGAVVFGIVLEGRDFSTPQRQFDEHFPFLLQRLRAEADVLYEDRDIVIFSLAGG